MIYELKMLINCSPFPFNTLWVSNNFLSPAKYDVSVIPEKGSL